MQNKNFMYKNKYKKFKKCKKCKKKDNEKNINGKCKK